MAGAPGAAVTQERPEQNHYGTLYNHKHNHQHILYKGAQTNTTIIVYKSTTPAHLIHLHIPEQGHQHHSVQSAQEPNTLKGCLLLDIFNSYIMVIHVRGDICLCMRVSVLGDG